MNLILRGPKLCNNFSVCCQGKIERMELQWNLFFLMTTGSGRRLCSNNKWEKHSKVASWLSNIFYNLKGLVYLAKQKALNSLSRLSVLRQIKFELLLVGTIVSVSSVRVYAHNERLSSSQSLTKVCVTSQLAHSNQEIWTHLNAAYVGVPKTWHRFNLCDVWSRYWSKLRHK